MLSQERQSTKSPATSVQSGSTRTAPATNSQRAQSVASSITERDEKSSVSTEPRPLPTTQRKFAESNNSASETESERGTPPVRNLARQKSSNSDSDEPISNRRPPPSPSETSVRTPIQSKPKSTIQSLVRNVARMGGSDKSERSDDSTTKKKSQTKYSPINNLIKVSARDFERGKSSVIPASVSRLLTNGKTKTQSVFEKVDLHTGSASYLGAGNYRNLEDCIRDCLSKDRYHRDWSHSSLKPLTRASVLEDYSYDGIISSNNHRHHYHHYLNIDDHHHHHHHRSSYSLLNHHRHKSPKDLTLEEIRHINDELAKYGISVFSSHHSNSHQRPQNIGEILSACQMLSNNPTLNQHSNHPDAVRHVWDQISYYQPAMPPPAPLAPAYPPAPTGGSGALSRLFGAPAAPPPAPFYPPAYPPPPPPATGGGGGGSVLSKLFGGSAAAPPPPMPYNAGPSMMPPSYPPPPPAGPPPAGGAGQSVLASLFGR